MFFLEILSEIFKEVIIYGVLQFPGAAIRWLFLRKKKTFKELLKDNFELNTLVSVLAIAFISFIVYQIKK
ncbi:hypothetical protein D3C87_255430 [compost metagenome]